MPSMKVMPSVESEPDWTTSPLLTLSPWFRMIETPLRIAVALPASLVTWPMTAGATLALPSACANWVCPVSALTMSPVRWAPSGEASAARFSPLKYSRSTSSRSPLERIRSTPDRLKSPLNSR